MGKNEHLKQAKAYTQTLSIEKAVSHSHKLQLSSDQGEATRCLIYHCTSAIVEALDELRQSIDRAGV